MWLKYASEPVESILDRDVAQLAAPNPDIRKFSYRGTDLGPADCCWKFRPFDAWITDDSEDNWRELCVRSGFRLHDLVCKHEVVLDESNLLILRTRDEIEDFSRDYAEVLTLGFCPAVARGQRRPPCESVYINWEKVASKYDGIIITPYQPDGHWKRITGWYYNWPWAAGVIWKVRAVKDVRLIEINPEIVNAQPDPNHLWETPPSIARRLDALEAAQEISAELSSPADAEAVTP